MAKIRHLVFQTTDPERLAKFYVDVMGLEIVHRSKNGGISLTDGYMNLSIHTNKIDGKPSGATDNREDYFGALQSAGQDKGAFTAVVTDELRAHRG